MALIVSDLGGVVVEIEADRCHRCWSSLSGLPVEEVRRRLFPDPVYEALERGEVSTEQYMAHVRSELDADISDETLTDCFNDIYLGLDTGVLAALARFRNEGHRVVALTNTNRSHHDRWWPMYREPLGVFDDIYLSFELGARNCRSSPGGWSWANHGQLMGTAPAESRAQPETKPRYNAENPPLRAGSAWSG